MIFKLGQKKAG